MKRILTIAAHPDDEVLGCGGAMARHAAEGDEVYVAILGEGATSRADQRGAADMRLVEGLKGDARRAAEALRVKEVFLHGLPDNRFDSMPLLDVVKIVEKRIADLSPHIVYTHHGGDLNVDHQVCFRAVLTATRPKPGFPVKEVLAFEVPSATEWGFGRVQAPFSPEVFVDISATLEAKLRALSQYPTEVCDFPHPRSPKAVEAAALRWGSVAGFPAAEAFELVRSLR
jgi:LmbE family N-acetylglucosaminyl deacetylase